MSETPEKRPEAEADVGPQDAALSRGEAIGRMLFLIAGGVLLATMVSCACSPVR